MARMFPAMPKKDCSPASLRVYEALRVGLDDQWTVVQGAAWVGRVSKTGGLTDGEIDFVLAHPEFGILTLALVSGGLRHDPSAGVWSVVGHDGQVLRVADPYQRARHAAEALLGKLAEHPMATPSRPAWGHGVLLPDALVPPRGFGAHAPEDITIDRQRWSRVAAAVLDLAQLWVKRQPAVGNAVARWWRQAFDDLFLAPREARVLLAQRLADDNAAMIALSPQQLSVLDLLSRVRKQAVFGPAGTGKTLLAMHKARTLARQGMRVLLTCYNRELGQHMRRAMADVNASAADGGGVVVAGHFHDLCYDLPGLRRDDHKAPEDDKQRRHFFDVDLPGWMKEGARASETRFDALVVDEAQDFLASYWRALDAWLVDSQRAVRYTFFDDAQRLRPESAPVEGAEQALTLTTNWRNTQAIHTHLTQVEAHMALAQCVAPQGVAVQHEPLRPNPGRALRRVLQRVCADGGVRPEDVVVLTGRSEGRSIYRDFAEVLLPWRLTREDAPGMVRLRGVRSFKGMEAPVVILSELEHLTTADARVLHYVGASRATSLLVVMEDAEVPPA